MADGASLASRVPAARRAGGFDVARFARSAAPMVALALLFFLVWHLVVQAFAVPPYVMPSPIATLRTVATEWHGIAGAAAFTLRNAIAGLVVAFTIAILLAALFVTSDVATRAVLPLVIAIRTAPVLAIAPLLILMFGRGIGTSIAVVVIVSFFPTMVNAMRGFRASHRSALELMHVLGSSRLQIFRKVRLPFALPFIFTGLRSAATSAVLAAMLAEWLSGAPGLGTYILNAAAHSRANLLWAAVLVSMAMAMIMYSLSSQVERWLSDWRG